MEEEDQLISSTNSSINYRKFYNWENSYDEDDKCGKLEKNLHNYKGIRELCLKLKGILEGFKFNRLYTLDDTHGCHVLNYWIYDYIFNEIIKKHSYENIASNITLQLLRSWDYIDPNKKCSLDSLLSNEDYFNKCKILYDYALDYETIADKIERANFKCSTEYNTYVEKAVRTYNKVKSECSVSPVLSNCKILEKIHEMHGVDKLSKLQCSGIKSPKLPSANLEGTYQGSHHTYAPQGISQFQGHSSPVTATAIVLPLIGIFLFLFMLYK
ncbi:PIR Superfamily Protein, partial [Plasmodium ovale curtisi]